MPKIATSVALVLISAFIITSIAVRVCAAKEQVVLRAARQYKAKAKHSRNERARNPEERWAERGGAGGLGAVSLGWKFVVQLNNWKISCDL